METITGIYSCPLGQLEIVAANEGITAISFLSADFTPQPSTGQGSDLIKETINQLSEYFAKKRKIFDIPLQLSGTEFQLSVWNELKNISYGQTVSYGYIADKLGSRDLVRAVGNANGKNPVAIVIPCHRVIGGQGDLIGYAGGMWRKKWLLDHENSQQSLLFTN